MEYQECIDRIMFHSMSFQKGGDLMGLKEDMDKLSTRLLRYCSDAERWADHEELLEISDFFRGRSSAFKQSANFIRAILKAYKKPIERGED